MTIIDHPTRTTWALRTAHRLEIVTTGGMEGILRVGDAVRACGFPVRDFVADSRDGVPYSSVTCTMSLTSAEVGEFATRLSSAPGVVSVEPC